MEGQSCISQRPHCFWIRIGSDTYDISIMKRIALGLMFSLFYVHIGCAQELDGVRFSVHYMTQFKRYEEEKTVRTEEFVLDVGDSRNCFYNRWYRRRNEVTDSLSALGGTFGDIVSARAEYPLPIQHYAIYDNWPSVGKRLVTDELFKKFYYEEDIENIEWVLVDRDTTILDYPCQMAVCDYRSRKWTAWYTTEIPVSLGPWKLRGLPGLIMYASDDSGVFAFECIELRNSTNTVAEPKLSKAIKCTQEELEQLFREWGADPPALERKMGLPGKGYDQHGRPLVYKPKTAIFLD